MFTPQQIEQIAFGTQTFGGYNIQQVDEFLEPLTEDYVTLYKENALLKSKMRVLVGKLEEYRKNEAAMKDAVIQAQQTCDKMVREAEVKCAQMLGDANTAVAENTRNTGALIAAEDARIAEARKTAGALIAAEDARVAEAQKTAAAKIDEIEEQMRACIQALERIKSANAPVAAPVAPVAPVAPAAPVAPVVPVAVSAPVNEPEPISADAMADQISMNLEALVGTTEDLKPKAAPRHPVNDSTTGRFANLNLQFGRNYDPTHK